MRTSLLIAISILQINLAFSQYTKPTANYQPDPVGENENILSPSKSVDCLGLFKIDPNQPVWTRTLTGVGTENEGPNPHELEEMKAKKLIEKRKSTIAGSPAGNDKASNPIVNANFNGNGFNSGTPFDNSMAISNGGIIVSAINSTLNYYNSSGGLISGSSFNSLINDPNLNGSFFDPKVIYDSGSDRFIVVVLHDSSPSTSRVIIGYSRSNDPTTGWYFYTLDGDILNNNSWFDYPSIAISNDELFITGNLFSSSNSFRESVIIQIEKGYSGGIINYRTWDNISGNPFTLLPVSLGQQGNYGPGIYLVSTRSGAGNSYFFYDLTNNQSSSPALNRSTINTPFYEAAADAGQRGTSALLSTGDSRSLSGFFQDNTIHFVHNVDVGSGWCGVRYTRLNVISRASVSSNFGNQGVADYAYPAIASFGSSATDKSVMISYETSSAANFPGIAVVNCDQNMQWSSSTTVKHGDNFVDILAGNERWGDYTGMARKQNASPPVVWLSAAYGNSSQAFSTRIAEITSGPAPEVSFAAAPLSGEAPLTVLFQDNSTGATSRTWTFPGGDPATSTSKSPTVVYNSIGGYDVTLEVSNQFGNATEIKPQYITVQKNTGIDDNDQQNTTKVYPNPVVDRFNVVFDVTEKTMLQIDLIDINGKLVKTLFEGNSKNGTNRFSFIKNTLSSGTYFLQIRSKEKLIVNEKIVIDG